MLENSKTHEDNKRERPLMERHQDAPTSRQLLPDELVVLHLLKTKTSKMEWEQEMREHLQPEGEPAKKNGASGICV